MEWIRKLEEFSNCLGRLSVWGRNGDEIQADEAFELWTNWTTKIRDSGKTVFFVGNGASASMASHFATDLAKNGRVRTQTFYDLSLITAMGNDVCFEEIFSEPLRLWMSKGDMLVAVSSSGQSPNIVRGVETALQMGGTVVTLTAMDAQNKLRTMGTLNYYVPAKTYGLAESSHAAILHHWMDRIFVEGRPRRD